MFSKFRKKPENVEEILKEDHALLDDDSEDDISIESIEEKLKVPEEYDAKCVIIAAIDMEGKTSEDRYLVTMAVDKAVKQNPEYVSFIREQKKEAMRLFGIQIDIEYYTLEEISKIREDVSRGTQKDKMVASTRIQKMAKELFTQAAKSKASDIHIRIENKVARIRFRVHGLLRDYAQWDANEGTMFIKTVYSTMAGDTDSHFQHQKSQNGRISDQKFLPPNLFALRMATTSHSEGIYAVFRLLYKQENIEDKDVDSLGYPDYQVKQIEKMKQKPTGINLIVGSTGSGKSTTLQIALSKIIQECKGQKNIITVEDPPEYPIFGATQTAVANAKTEEERKEKFNEKITAAMRLDPDIIMLGEIRDGASASLGIRAAMTGHQVWSTLHANGIFGAIDRLVDYDVSIDMLADPQILTGIIYQKLVPILCDGCKVPLKSMTDMTQKQKDNLKRLSVIAFEKGMISEQYNMAPLQETIFYRGNGCEKCEGGPKGIAGRTVAAEVLYPDDKILEYIRKGEKEMAKKYWKETLKGETVEFRAGVIALDGQVDPIMAEDAVGFFINDFDLKG